MKFISPALVAVLFVLCLESAALSQTRLGCNYPATSDNRGTYYMSCFNRLNGETTDSQRIQYAVDYIQGGKLVFDKTLYENGYHYTVSSAINLHSNLILEGTGTGSTVIPASSAIKLTASGTATVPASIFKIGQLVNDVTIRDLGLFADNTATNYTVGILAEGSYIPGVATASLHFQFNNIRFTGLTTGIKVNALDSIYAWQFDNVKLEHCVFEACQTGVYINSFNSGWQMNSIEFFGKSNSNGVFIERGTYTAIDSMIGNLIDSIPADTFIKIKDIATPVTLRNCVSEGYVNDLIVESTGNTVPLTITGSTFQGVVKIKNTDLLSTGNFFGTTTRDNNNQIIYRGPQPIAHGTTRVTSIADKFCKEGEDNCATGGYVIDENAYIVFSSDLNKNLINRPSFYNHLIDITTDLPFQPYTPLLTLIRPTYNDVPLLRLGTGVNHYTLSRNGFGYLKFVGSQDKPYKGYNFDGPVKLPDYEVHMLPTILENGSMAFCSNCQSGTTPCAAGTGGGALAISISGSWSCK